MKSTRTLLAWASAGCLLAAATTVEADPKPWSLKQIEDALPSAAETIVDVISWIGPKPPPQPEFQFSDSRYFDMQLHQSMDAKLGKINVLVDGAFASDAPPERIGRWLRAIDVNGEVRTCIVDDKAKGFLSFLPLLLSAFKLFDQWMLYRPAKDYDAIQIVTPGDSKVLNVVFPLRGTTRGCPTGTVPSDKAASPPKS